MTDIAIRVENLSKQYHIGVGGDGAFRYKALRDTLTDAMVAPFRALATAVRRPLTAASSSDGGLPPVLSGAEGSAVGVVTTPSGRCKMSPLR